MFGQRGHDLLREVAHVSAEALPAYNVRPNHTLAYQTIVMQLLQRMTGQQPVHMLPGVPALISFTGSVMLRDRPLMHQLCHPAG